MMPILKILPLLSRQLVRAYIIYQRAQYRQSFYAFRNAVNLQTIGVLPLFVVNLHGNVKKVISIRVIGRWTTYLYKYSATCDFFLLDFVVPWRTSLVLQCNVLRVKIVVAFFSLQSHRGSPSNMHMHVQYYWMFTGMQEIRQYFCEYLTCSTLLSIPPSIDNILNLCCLLMSSWSKFIFWIPGIPGSQIIMRC